MHTFLRIKSCFCFILFLLCSHSASANDAGHSGAVAHKDIDFYNDDLQRPTKVRFWYLAGDESCAAKICLGEDQKQHRIAIISHGAFGSPLGMSWLGEPMAAAGWLVMGVAHFGESMMYAGETIDPKVVTQFWRRPQDVRFLIDRLNDDGLFNMPLDTSDIAMLGHSSGGFTALALAGARLEDGKTEQYCQSERALFDRGCSYVSNTELVSLQESALEIGRLQSEMLDPRIGRLVALGHAVDESSLSEISIPVLIVGSVENDFLPFEVHAGNYAKHIDNAQLLPVEQGAGHFVYINSCDFDIKAAGVSICEDREGVDRDEIQQKLLKDIFTFLGAN